MSETIKADPVTGEVPVIIDGETVKLRFTNSAYAYVEEEAGVEAAQDAITKYLQSGIAGKIQFSLVLAFGRAALRAAGIDPIAVDKIARDDLVQAVTALVLSAVDPVYSDENPQKAAG